MSYIKDFREQNLHVRKLYWFQELVNPMNYIRTARYRHQRAERGWSDRDTWGGGEHLAEVAAGILDYLDNVQNVVDWDAYFKNNYEENYGYASLTEVAQDITNYLAWEEESFSEPIYEEYKDHNETRWAIEWQLYNDYKNAMHFVAENIGGLWW